jgi:flagellar hook protein FlgE
MTAFTAIYSSLTGLQAFTSALDVVSDNVANLNTVGYKGTEVLFDDLGGLGVGSNADQGDFDDTIGQGVALAGQERNFSEGQIQETDNPTDLAINGSGFFIVQQNGQTLYTRDGQFTFNSSGQLVESATGAVVQAIGANGALSDFVVNQNQTMAATPSTTVTFDQTLSTAQGTEGTAATDTVSGIDVVDASGTSQTLSAAFTQDTSNTTAGETIWNVTVTNSSGETLATGQITFDGAGNAEPGFDTLDVVVPASNGQSSEVAFDFSSATSSSTVAQSNLQVESANGVASGSLTGITFDQNGVAQLSFSNGQTETGPQVALATFSNPEELVPSGGNGFIIPEGSPLQPTLGAAGESGFGSIEAGNVELANIDLGQEFANVIIMQQGYQGSSQVLNVSSQLLDTLYSALDHQ